MAPEKISLGARSRSLNLGRSTARQVTWERKKTLSRWQEVLWELGSPTKQAIERLDWIRTDDRMHGACLAFGAFSTESLRLDNE